MTLRIYQNDPHFLTSAYFSGLTLTSYDMVDDGIVRLFNPSTGAITQVDFYNSSEAESLESYFQGGSPSVNTAPIRSVQYYNSANQLVAEWVQSTGFPLTAATFVQTLQLYEIVGDMNILSALFNAGPGYDTLFNAINLVPTGPYAFDNSTWDDFLTDSFSAIRGSAYNDNIYGSDIHGQTIYAGSGNDQMLARSGSTTFHGEDGDDVLAAGNWGVHTFYGGNGTDMLTFDAPEDAYTVNMIAPGSATVSHANGFYSVYDTEFIEFQATTAAGTEVTYYDVGDTRNWTSVTRTLDGFGALTEVTFLRDNGRGVDITYSGGLRQTDTITDLADNHSWTSISQSYFFGSFVTSRTIVQDDGRDITTSYSIIDGTSQRTATDTADAFVWSSIVTNFDAAGTIQDQTMTFDDGREMVSAYSAGVLTTQTTTDHDDMFGWTSVIDSFDATGARTARDITYDDGGTAHFDYTPI